MKLVKIVGLLEVEADDIVCYTPALLREDGVVVMLKEEWDEVADIYPNVVVTEVEIQCTTRDYQCIVVTMMFTNKQVTNMSILTVVDKDEMYSLLKYDGDNVEKLVYNDVDSRHYIVTTDGSIFVCAVVGADCDLEVESEEKALELISWNYN